jgi:hypothetical protein
MVSAENFHRSARVLPAARGHAGHIIHHYDIAGRALNSRLCRIPANRAHARLRSPGERANAQLKCWRILRKLRCCPWRAGQLAKAIHVLQTREIGG